MKNININKIKELCAKGLVLFMLTGTVTATTMSAPAYTVSAATKTLKSTKSSALKKLLAAYNSYDKDNYYSTQYKSITKYYNTGVTKINDCKTKNGVSKMLDTYKKKMAKVKDKKTVLAEYKIKMQKSLLENYKDLVENNNYDSNGLKELESIYNTYNAKINKTTTKTKAKKHKNTAISKMENVCTKVIVNADGTKTMSLEQVDKKVKALCKKYPAYTEEEIRTLYVTINMTEFNFDLYEYLEVSSKSELEEKAILLDEMLDNMYLANVIEYQDVTRGPKFTIAVDYDDIVYLPDFIENEEIKNESKKLCQYIYDVVHIATFQGEICEGNNLLKLRTTATMMGYFYNYYNPYTDKTYIKESIPKYSIDSNEAKTRSDLQIVNLYFARTMNTTIIDWRYYQYYPDDKNNLYIDRNEYIQNNRNPIYGVCSHKYVLK